MASLAQGRWASQATDRFFDRWKRATQTGKRARCRRRGADGRMGERRLAGVGFQPLAGLAAVAAGGTEGREGAGPG
ncbi:MAG: hypothetical protein ACK53L_09500, partial [Pirellulaceae bacterium]